MKRIIVTTLFVLFAGTASGYGIANIRNGNVQRLIANRSSDHSVLNTQEPTVHIESESPGLQPSASKPKADPFNRTYPFVDFDRRLTVVFPTPFTVDGEWFRFGARVRNPDGGQGDTIQPYRFRFTSAVASNVLIARIRSEGGEILDDEVALDSDTGIAAVYVAESCETVHLHAMHGEIAVMLDRVCAPDVDEALTYMRDTLSTLHDAEFPHEQFGIRLSLPDDWRITDDADSIVTVRTPLGHAYYAYGERTSLLSVPEWIVAHGSHVERVPVHASDIVCNPIDVSGNVMVCDGIGIVWTHEQSIVMLSGLSDDLYESLSSSITFLSEEEAPPSNE